MNWKLRRLPENRNTLDFTLKIGYLDINTTRTPLIEANQAGYSILGKIAIEKIKG
jgi:hypothetical protein